MQTFRSAILLVLGAVWLGTPAEGQDSRLPLLRTPVDGLAPGPDTLRPTPLGLDLSYRSSYADDRHNGALWTGRGVSLLARGGFAATWRRVEVVVQPEVTWSQNRPYVVVTERGVEPAGSTAPWLDLDIPRIWGDGTRAAVLPGNSSLTVRLGNVSVGASSANTVRGPGRRYPLVLGSSGPGFPHFFAEGGASLGPVGRIAARAQWGLLRESPFFDDEEAADRALLTGLFVDWSPSWADGLVLGASAVYRDPFERFRTRQLFRLFGQSSAQDAEGLGENAQAALHVRWSGPRLSAWSSVAREDYWLNGEDLLTEIAHSLFWNAGVSTRWQTGATTWRLTAEAIDTGSGLNRSGLGAYRHSSGVGHTHRGQWLAAPVGPGGHAAHVTLRRARAGTVVGLSLERIDYDELGYAKVLRRADGAAGEDREWRLTGRWAGPVSVGSDRIDASFRIGAATRRNRDYLQYDAASGRALGDTDVNLILDVALAWDPRGPERAR